MDRDLENEVQIQITEAIKQHDIAAFHRIVDSHPEWPTHDNCLGYPHDIAAYRLDTFKAFVARFPQTKDWHCGHSGNPVGLAALVRDVELLRALLEDVGCCANKGWFYYRPVRHPSLVFLFPPSRCC
ncbi:hypothetical protein IQ06DRAFT_299050 [Phaeosphaeriaceae sp. SRC1lsM3a]|nr:hypothetical protein IQ06DRAFT_299050 [Stagonospora sp. SRC1lsM3a]